jgi:hypothetical protein
VLGRTFLITIVETVGWRAGEGAFLITVVERGRLPGVAGW